MRRADHKTPKSINPTKSSKENSEKKKTNARKAAHQDVASPFRDYPVSASQSARISPQKLGNSSALNMMKSQEKIF